MYLYFSNNFNCLICMQYRIADSCKTCYKVAYYNCNYCSCILLNLQVPVLILFKMINKILLQYIYYQ